MTELINRNHPNRHERRSAALLETAPPNRVRSLQETAELSDISLATLRRRIKDGTGPRVISMSPRRKGVTDRDREAWLDSCAERGQP